MMHIEYSLYDLEYSEEEIKQNIEKAKVLGIKSISAPYAWTKLCKSLVKDTGIIVSNAIDYPLGIMDTKTRNNAIVNAIENGAEKLEIVIQNNYLNNKKYDKIRADIKSNYDICQQNNILLQYFLEYRIFTHQSLIKACNLLLEVPIDTVYVSTGHMIDNTEDNVIATMLLAEKTKINTVFTGNIWNKKQVEILRKNNIKKARLNTINAIGLCGQI
jgi:deoxyribose-phosphate aldolase